jgi:hypothetical protein
MNSLFLVIGILVLALVYYKTSNASLQRHNVIYVEPTRDVLAKQAEPAREVIVKQEGQDMAYATPTREILVQQEPQAMLYAE